MELREYQKQAILSSKTALEEGFNRQLFVLPTGAGKTVVFSEILREKVLEGKKCLVIAHRKELLDQAKEKISAIIGDSCDAIIFSGKDKKISPKVTIASIQSASRNLDLFNEESFDVLVIDEAHHAQAKTYKNLIERLDNRLNTSNNLEILGFTATPNRGDKRDILEVFSKIVFSIGIEDLISKGHLVKPRAIRTKVTINLDSVGVDKSDFVSQDLRKEMIAKDAIDLVVDTAKIYAEKKPGIIFAVDIIHGRMLEEEFMKKGFLVKFLHSEMSISEREEAIKSFNEGAIQFLINVMILTEGFDSPRAEVMINAAPTLNKSLYAQKAGRVLRKHPGKTEALLIDFGSTRRSIKLAGVEDIIPKKKSEEEKKEEKTFSSGKAYDPKLDAAEFGEDKKVELVAKYYENSYGISEEILEGGRGITFKQAKFLEKICEEVTGKTFAVGELKKLDKREASSLIKKFLEKQENLNDKAPITNKQLWFLKMNEKIFPESVLRKLSKYEASKRIQKIKQNRNGNVYYR